MYALYNCWNMEIRPQPKQEQFLASEADIVIFGGAAGGGKSYALMIEPLRHIIEMPGFYAVLFRRTTTDITNPGGPWDASFGIYPLTGAKPRQAPILDWQWPRGGRLKMAHLEKETSVYGWQGSEVPLIMFDELTHFSMAQFFYMLSRNRTKCGVRPYIRATCNPDADSWVASILAWWIDDDGYAIPERSGVIRWFVRLDDRIMWADSKREAIELYGDPALPDDHDDQVEPMSFTFILSMLSDNTKGDPDYRRKLKAMDRVNKERLLGGNWKIKPAPGLYFKREDATMLDERPDDIIKSVRQWDLASTEKRDDNDPDWTEGVFMGRRANGRFVIADLRSCREGPGKVRALVKSTAAMDGPEVHIGLHQDPGQAGKDQVQNYATELAGYIVKSTRETGSKIVRAESFASAWQHGLVDVVRGAWNDHLFGQLEAFPDDKVHDDVVDTCSSAFNRLAKGLSLYDDLD